MKAKLTLLTFFLFLNIGATYATEADAKPSVNQQRAEQLVQRVQDIRKTDFSTLSQEEKSELKEELKSMKREMKTLALDDTVTLSVGALVIIILLLIILL